MNKIVQLDSKEYSDSENLAAQAFIKLIRIMDDLRLLCPWDKKQTIDSLRILTIEEMYELSESLLEKN